MTATSLYAVGPTQQDIEDERRAAAALAATKDFTTRGLEEIAERGLTLQLALRATWMMETEGMESFGEMEKQIVKGGRDGIRS